MENLFSYAAHLAAHSALGETDSSRQQEEGQREHSLSSKTALDMVGPGSSSYCFVALQKLLYLSFVFYEMRANTSLKS